MAVRQRALLLRRGSSMRQSIAEVLIGWTLVVGWVAVFVIAACSPPPPVPPPTPSAATCADVCDNLRVLGCELAEPTPAGMPCEGVCLVNAEIWGLGCMVSAQTCESADSC